MDYLQTVFAITLLLHLGSWGVAFVFPPMFDVIPWLPDDWNAKGCPSSCQCGFDSASCTKPLSDNEASLPHNIKTLELINLTPDEVSRYISLAPGLENIILKETTHDVILHEAEELDSNPIVELDRSKPPSLRPCSCDLLKVWKKLDSTGLTISACLKEGFSADSFTLEEFQNICRERQESESSTETSKSSELHDVIDESEKNSNSTHEVFPRKEVKRRKRDVGRVTRQVEENVEEPAEEGADTEKATDEGEVTGLGKGLTVEEEGKMALERERLAEERKKELERKIAEQKLARERAAEERKKELERKIAEQKLARERATEERRQELERKNAEEKPLREEAARNRLAEQKEPQLPGPTEEQSLEAEETAVEGNQESERKEETVVQHSPVQDENPDVQEVNKNEEEETETVEEKAIPVAEELEANQPEEQKAIEESGGVSLNEFKEVEVEAEEKVVSPQVKAEEDGIKEEERMRAAEEQQTAIERLQAEQKLERERLAEERKKELERKIAEQKLKRERLAEERKRELERKIAEQKLARERAAEERKKELERKTAEQKLAREGATEERRQELERQNSEEKRVREEVRLANEKEEKTPMTAEHNGLEKEEEIEKEVEEEEESESVKEASIEQAPKTDEIANEQEVSGNEIVEENEMYEAALEEYALAAEEELEANLLVEQEEDINVEDEQIPVDTKNEQQYNQLGRQFQGTEGHDILEEQVNEEILTEEVNEHVSIMEEGRQEEEEAEEEAETENEVAGEHSVDTDSTNTASDRLKGFPEPVREIVGNSMLDELTHIDEEVLEQLKEFLSTTKIDLPVDINDPYDLGLLLRHLRHHSSLLANIDNPKIRKQILDAMQEGDIDAI